MAQFATKLAFRALECVFGNPDEKFLLGVTRFDPRAERRAPDSDDTVARRAPYPFALPPRSRRTWPTCLSWVFREAAELGLQKAAVAPRELAQDGVPGCLN